MKNRIELWINENIEQIYNTFNKLHSIPEKSTQEFKTAAYIEEVLAKNQINYKRICETGVVGLIQTENTSKTLGLRADIDALEFKTDTQSVMGHFCGHDANTTIVLMTAILAKDLNLVKNGNLKLIFQPSEEQEWTSGARCIIKEGETNDLDYLLGIHLRPIDEAKKGEAIASLLHGSLTTIKVMIKGKGGHGGRPHQSINPINAAAAVIDGINSIKLDPFLPWSVKATAINADGGNTSTIPESSHLTLDLRAGTNDLMEDLVAKTIYITENTAKANSCSASIEVIPGLSASKASKKMQEFASVAIKTMLTEEADLGIKRSPGADDFNEYTKHKNDLEATFIGLGCDMSYGLHDKNMDFNKKAIEDGIKILAYMVYQILQ